MKVNTQKLIYACISITILSCTQQKTIIKSANNRKLKSENKEWAFEHKPFWSEEFNYKGLPDNTKWKYETGGSGWGNNELEYYTKSLQNASVAKGKLIITARKENIGKKSYSSARLVSVNGGSLLYGRVEVKAKLPSGRGTWPAIWLLPDQNTYGGWPKSGEIDVMEMVGYDPNNVHFTVHTELYNGAMGTQKGNSKLIPTSGTSFHKYRMDWTPDAIKGYYDDQLIFTYLNDGKGSPSWPFNQKFHLLLNLAVGGNWGGIKGVDDNAFPTAMQVDYVRFYKMKSR